MQFMNCADISVAPMNRYFGLPIALTYKVRRSAGSDTQINGYLKNELRVWGDKQLWAEPSPYKKQYCEI